MADEFDLYGDLGGDDSYDLYREDPYAPPAAASTTAPDPPKTTDPPSTSKPAQTEPKKVEKEEWKPTEEPLVGGVQRIQTLEDLQRSSHDPHMHEAMDPG